MGAARNKGDILARARQPAAEIPADTARPEYNETHSRQP
jgi:hypothetical protein